MNDQKQLAIIILIGGTSKRFGFAKGTIEINGKPLILYQIETLAEFDEDIYLSVNSEEQMVSIKTKIEFPKVVNFIIDERRQPYFKEIYTPMIGIYSAFKQLRNQGFEKAFTLSGDAPLIKSSMIRYMIDQLNGYDCVVPRWDNGFLETLFAIYPVDSTFYQAKKIIEKKEHYALDDLIDESWNINYISVKKELKPLDPNLLSLININGPIDIEKVKSELKKAL
jgi:molybdopterin-guanine dinucleotide biosynthesis protein A